MLLKEKLLYLWKNSLENTHITLFKYITINNLVKDTKKKKKQIHSRHLSNPLYNYQCLLYLLDIIKPVPIKKPSEKYCGSLHILPICQPGVLFLLQHQKFSLQIWMVLPSIRFVYPSNRYLNNLILVEVVEISLTSQVVSAWTSLCQVSIQNALLRIWAHEHRIT